MTVLFHHVIPVRDAGDPLHAVHYVIDLARDTYPISGDLQISVVRHGDLYHVEITRLPGPAEGEKP